jgi:hypothetical protein
VRTVTTHDFAEAYGISDRAARQAFKNACLGLPWRGETLPIAPIPSQQGGQSGRVYGLMLDIAPDAIRAKLSAHLGIDETPVKQALKASYQEQQFDVQAVRYGIIEPILATEKRTSERAEAFRSMAAQVHIYKGAATRLSKPTLQLWVRQYEAKGLQGSVGQQTGGFGHAKSQGYPALGQRD